MKRIALLTLVFVFSGSARADDEDEFGAVAMSVDLLAEHAGYLKHYIENALPYTPLARMEERARRAPTKRSRAALQQAAREVRSFRDRAQKLLAKARPLHQRCHATATDLLRDAGATPGSEAHASFTRTRRAATKCKTECDALRKMIEHHLRDDDSEFTALQERVETILDAARAKETNEAALELLAFEKF